MNSGKNKVEKYDGYKNYIDSLKDEYRRSFDKIEMYITGSSKLNTSEKNNCLLQVLDTFLSAQEQEKPVIQVTGPDLKRYCDDMIYGERIYIYKSSRIFFALLGTLFYISYMQVFPRIFDAIKLKDIKVIFSSINFGIADIILMLGYICIPKIISFITKSQFENPKRCRSIKRYTYGGIWLFTIMIYSFIKSNDTSSLMVISFSRVCLVLLYLGLINFVIFFLMKVLEQGDLEEAKEAREQKYLDKLNKKYQLHVEKRSRYSKEPLDFKQFKANRVKSNYFTIVVFSIYFLIFLVLAALIGRGMYLQDSLDTFGIVFLFIIALLNILIAVSIKYFILINEKLLVP
jgi:DNA-binding ferritin-like protein (Dps family)